MKKKKKIISICLLVLFIVSSLNMTVAAIDGREVMERVDERDTGDSRHALMGMDLIDSDGNVRPRVLEVWSQKVDFERDLDHTVMVFHEPSSIKNTRFLQKENDGEDDDQWIYLPDLGRVRRISGGQGGDSFMGSDFTYDDMKSREIDDFDYELLDEEEFNGYECYVVEATPKNPEDEQYAKTISWVTKEHYIPVKVEMYDKDSEELYKEMRVESEVKKIDGIWTVFSTLMTDLDSGHKTNLYVKKRDNNYLLEYNVDINDRRFTQQFLQTGR
ncbi:outer membrane lipoprotein-sorting protein [Halanaerobium saccharolyticum]|uniref:Outer membrane lipoprotein-sorting protein n=1 Tax=Halanaerobium saccharolyticum TaxID=43595 RepID=A0A4R7Z1H8_9FIRM|nr:outer membrane lipoprotein-sorting protein [Halanaerobium saccharolyticum]RAK08931.1 outer membrane lipoprotein-sorting protein [Halanaerobium saccharolyticum]TDW02675.1 outer membrane lipoprotein-sorting protein [Halanaerobium saccharolyticum]TDX60694.1 outer membrane lipoprotein-sorting protein [Halanaerobium saccharolyticum]